MRTKKQSGQGIVEFAIVLPFMMIVMILMIEVSLFLGTFVRLINVSRECARQIAVHANEEGVIDLIQDKFGDGFSDLRIDIAYESETGEEILKRSDTSRGNLAVVQCTCKIYPLLVPNILLEGFSLQTQTVMMIEN